MAPAISHDALDASPNDNFSQLNLNDIGRRLMLQRPALFNHATALFRDHPELLHREIPVHPDALRRGEDLLSRQDPLPLLSTNGQFGVEYCFQIANLQLDPHPRNQPGLLDPDSPPCQLAMVLQICGAVMCTAQDQSSSKQLAHGFSLDLFATASARWVGPAHQRQLSVALGALEIADVDAGAVSSSSADSAGYVLTTLKVGVMPRIRVALESMAFELGQFATEAIAPPIAPLWARPAFPTAGLYRESMVLN